MISLYFNSDDPDGMNELVSSIQSASGIVKKTEVEVAQYGVEAAVSLVIELKLSITDAVAIAALIAFYLKRRRENWIATKPSSVMITDANQAEIPKLLTDLRQKERESE